MNWVARKKNTTKNNDEKQSIDLNLFSHFTLPLKAIYLE